MTMNTKWLYPFVLLALIGAGCSSPITTPEVSAPTAAPAAGTPAAPTALAGCSHPYYPLRAGSSISYQMPTKTGTQIMKVSVTANTGDQATLNYVFPDTNVELNQTLKCTAGGVYPESYLDLASQISGVSVNSETKNVSGPLLPADVKVGSEWDTSFDVVIHIDSAQAAAIGITEMNQTTVTHRKAVGFEDVTVPAGTFHALKVESHMTSTITGIPGMSTPRVSDTTEYWVEGVGLIKSDSASSGGSSVMEATEVVK